MKDPGPDPDPGPDADLSVGSGSEQKLSGSATLVSGMLASLHNIPYSNYSSHLVARCGMLASLHNIP